MVPEPQLHAGHIAWHAIVVQSKGYEEDTPKDQDRARWFPHSRVACVCDGTSTSPYAAEAAELVASQAERFFANVEAPTGHREACALLRRELLRRRQEAAERPVRTGEGLPEMMRAALLAAARERLRWSHQTTVVAAQFDAIGDELRVRLLQCGDSRLLVFGAEAELLCFSSTRSPAGENGSALGPAHGKVGLGFPERSSLTDVFPDSPDDAVAWWPSLRFRRHESALLTSDGFLDAFDTPAELYHWLLEHEHDLVQESSHDEILLALHHRLAERRGDDDISFVWVRPSRADHPTAGGV